MNWGWVREDGALSVSPRCGNQYFFFVRVCKTLKGARCRFSTASRPHDFLIIACRLINFSLLIVYEADGRARRPVSLFIWRRVSHESTQPTLEWKSDFQLWFAEKCLMFRNWFLPRAPANLSECNKTTYNLSKFRVKNFRMLKAQNDVLLNFKSQPSRIWNLTFYIKCGFLRIKFCW